MFEGEKTWVFWIGLIILALASVSLFSIVWYNALYWGRYGWSLDYQVPLIAGAVVFILISLYMMKSGTRKERPPKIQPLKQQ